MTIVRIRVWIWKTSLEQLSHHLSATSLRAPPPFRSYEVTLDLVNACCITSATHLRHWPPLLRASDLVLAVSSKVQRNEVH